VTLLENPKRSVLQDWVMELPLREQGTLLTCVRGCDLTTKWPLDSTERKLVAFLRWGFMVPCDEREVDSELGCFFSSRPPVNWKASELGHYPLHWVSHIIHASEVLGYRHPVLETRMMFLAIYKKIVKSLHLSVESMHHFELRMSEDRIESGEIVP